MEIVCNSCGYKGYLFTVSIILLCSSKNRQATASIVTLKARPIYAHFRPK